VRKPPAESPGQSIDQRQMPIALGRGRRLLFSVSGNSATHTQIRTHNPPLLVMEITLMI